MENNYTEKQVHTTALCLKVKKRSDKLINYFLISFFFAGLILALFYDTWFIAFGVGGCSLLAYYFTKEVLPDSTLYQYVLSVVLAIFMAQYIYQMHGLFEMHFFAFIASAILITYQNWKLQIPLVVIVIIHHAGLGYLQNIGIQGVYFTQLDTLELQTFIIHIILAAVIFFTCGLWAYQLRQQTQQLVQSTKAAEQANIDLERKNKELEQFAYVASHDLQEPLRTTSSFVELLMQQYQDKLDERADKYFTYILEASDRMKLLITNLLDYSRIGSEKELEEVDCDKTLHEVLDDLGAAINDAKANIQRHRLPVIIGYPTEIKQLFQNLIINAVKFQKKGVSPQIKISVEKIKDIWQFKFEDNGIGIEKQHSEKIFNIFQRLHTRTEYEGSGIGLSHCKKIVELHKGKIWVESTYGEGSTFNFTLSAEAGIKENNN